MRIKSRAFERDEGVPSSIKDRTSSPIPLSVVCRVGTAGLTIKGASILIDVSWTGGLVLQEIPSHTPNRTPLHVRQSVRGLVIRKKKESLSASDPIPPNF
jgi:hypothetical protein